MVCPSPRHLFLDLLPNFSHTAGSERSWHRCFVSLPTLSVHSLLLIFPCGGAAKNCARPLETTIPFFHSGNNSPGAKKKKKNRRANLKTKRSMSSSHQILSTTTVTARGGLLHRVKHASTSTQTDMVFAIFLPSSYMIGANKAPLPAICRYFVRGAILMYSLSLRECKHERRVLCTPTPISPLFWFRVSLLLLSVSSTDWLSGLTCTDQNFCQKAGSKAFDKAEQEGIAL